MRYWLLGILTGIASLAGAENTAGGDWDGWDELPEDMLNLSGASSAEQLSQRLDSLIQQNPESADVDRLLELWLEQTATAAGSDARPSIPLQSLIGMTEPGPPGLSGPANGHTPERLQHLLQGLPANPGAGGGGGPPIDLPSPPGNASKPDVPSP